MQQTIQQPHRKDCLPFEFSADTGSYYRLWLGNLILTVLTLGIYSAWAKVRVQRFLLGHTRLAGGRFDYHGKPGAILKGRLLMLALFLLWQLSGSWSPALQGLLGMAAFLLAPWLAVQAMRFRLANTSWNQMRLRFDGKVGQAYLAYVKSWLTTTFTFGLFWPRATLIRRRYLLQHSTLGQARLQQQDCIGRLYLAGVGCLLSALLYLAAFGALGGLIWKVGDAIALPATVNGWFGSGSMQSVDFAFIGALMAAWLLASLGYARMAINRVLLNHTTLALNGQSHRIENWISTRHMLWLHLSNALALLCSLGLAWPWVRIRTLRAQLEHIALFGAGDLASLRAELNELDDARGDELADLLELDLGW
ncbi:YjgN family protein [Vogesella oryzae]|uniref:YjgN family protein n=1 Tax=Vogesella oryzae TaxID=1735285 RepID=UPI00158208D5|nr:YjgN family protein [Vogesella oryzae]